MPMTVIVYRLSVYFSLCLTVSSLYLPMMRTASSARRTRMPQVTSDLGSSYRSSGNDGDAFSKRRNVYGAFSNMMTRHAHRHKTDQAFVDRMFNIFDIDGTLLKFLLRDGITETLFFYDFTNDTFWFEDDCLGDILDFWKQCLADDDMPFK